MPRWTLITIAILLAVSCKKNSSPHSTTDPRDPIDSITGVKVGFTIDVMQSGKMIPADFTGLSYEAGDLPNPGYFNDSNTSFVNLMKGLGKGVIRVGGNSLDHMPWVAVAAAGVDLRKVVTNNVNDRLFKFAAATGWKVMYGLNLGTETPKYDAMEAAYIYSNYSKQLLCFEIGNEPDLFFHNGLRSTSYTYSDYVKDFNVFTDSIRGRVPEAVFSGPNTAAYTNEYLVPFAKDEHQRVQLLTQHYYKMGPPYSPDLSIEKLLNGNSGIISQARTMAAAAAPYKLPFRITESNSIYGGGTAGISNTLAAALWGLDLMFVLAEEGGAGINFHGGVDVIYTPIDAKGGVFSAKPLYYGMLLFSQASTGSLLAARRDTSGMTDSVNLAVHAVKRQDGAVLVTLINKDLSKQGIVNLSLNKTDTTTVRLGGAVVDNNGHWRPTDKENATLTQSGCMVAVPAASAVLVVLQ